MFAVVCVLYGLAVFLVIAFILCVLWGDHDSDV